MTINSLPSCRNHVSRHINISSCDQDKWNFLSAYNMCYTKLNSYSVDLFGPYMVRFTFTVSHSWCRVTLNLYCEGKKKCIKISLSIPLIPQVQSPEMQNYFFICAIIVIFVYAHDKNSMPLVILSLYCEEQLFIVWEIRDFHVLFSNACMAVFILINLIIVN